jgi:sugar phosphate isomerase/epimerase
VSTERFERRLGIFARTFRRGSAIEVGQAVAAAGFGLAHWNFAAIGQDTLAPDADVAAFDEVRRAFDQVGVTIPSVSATFNVIDPDLGRRAERTRDAVRLIGLVGRLGADVVTICTGTRHASDMWQAHPANLEPVAWFDLRATLDPLLAAAEAAGVRIGVEPELGNVVADVDRAARLLAELGDDAPIGIVLDPANLLTPESIGRQDEVVGHAVDELGPRVIGIQVKDVVATGYSAAGAGVLDYPSLLRQLARLDPVPIIVQDADELDAARVRTDLLRWHRDASARR